MARSYAVHGFCSRRPHPRVPPTGGHTMSWSTRDIPPQQGRLAVITGATGGLGYETALALAGAGADVVLTGRNVAKGQDAIQRIRGQFPNADISYETLD